MAIAFDFEQTFAELTRLSRDLEHFPAAEEVAVVEGGVSAVAQADTAPPSGRAPGAGESGAPGVEASADSDTTVEADY